MLSLGPWGSIREGDEAQPRNHTGCPLSHCEPPSHQGHRRLHAAQGVGQWGTWGLRFLPDNPSPEQGEDNVEEQRPPDDKVVYPSPVVCVQCELQEKEVTIPLSSKRAQRRTRNHEK